MEPKNFFNYKFKPHNVKIFDHKCDIIPNNKSTYRIQFLPQSMTYFQIFYQQIQTKIDLHIIITCLLMN